MLRTFKYVWIHSYSRDKLSLVVVGTCTYLTFNPSQLCSWVGSGGMVFHMQLYFLAISIGYNDKLYSNFDYCM